MTVQEMIDKRRKETLVSLGYYEKEYSGEAAKSDAYPMFDDDKGQSYRPVAMRVTDEQFEQILKVESIGEKSSAGVLPKVLCWIGALIMVACFIIGAYSANTLSDSYMVGGSAFTVFLIWAGAGILGGTLWIWMGEVLKVLRRK